MVRKVVQPALVHVLKWMRWLLQDRSEEPLTMMKTHDTLLDLWVELVLLADHRRDTAREVEGYDRRWMRSLDLPSEKASRAWSRSLVCVCVCDVNNLVLSQHQRSEHQCKSQTAADLRRTPMGQKVYRVARASERRSSSFLLRSF